MKYFHNTIDHDCTGKTNVYPQHCTQTRLAGAKTSLEEDASCIMGSDVTPLCEANRLLRWRPWLLRCIMGSDVTQLCEANRLLRWRPWLLRCIMGSDVTPLCQGNRLLRWRPCCVTIVHCTRIFRYSWRQDEA